MPGHIKRANVTNDAATGTPVTFNIKAVGRLLEDRFQWKRRRPTFTRYIKRFVNRVDGVEGEESIAGIKHTRHCSSN